MNPDTEMGDTSLSKSDFLKTSKTITHIVMTNLPNDGSLDNQIGGSDMFSMNHGESTERDLTVVSSPSASSLGPSRGSSTGEIASDWPIASV